MINLPYFHPHCNTWTEQKIENISQNIEECPYCLSIRSLKVEFMATVWRWDLKLPDDWQFPQWESVKLLPVHVKQPVLRCSQCGEAHQSCSLVYSTRDDTHFTCADLCRFCLRIFRSNLAGFTPTLL